jgi:hypothetical protein
LEPLLRGEPSAIIAKPITDEMTVLDEWRAISGQALFLKAARWNVAFCCESNSVQKVVVVRTRRQFDVHAGSPHGVGPKCADASRNPIEST